MSVAKRPHVFVLVDALGWKLLESQPFLDDLLTYRRRVRTVLGYSSGAIPTILTGAMPAENGHWNLFYYDPQGSPFRWLRHFGFLPGPVLNHRVTRKLLKEMGRRVLGLGPLFECCVSPSLLPWFNWVEKRSIYERGGITGAPSIFDELDASGIPCRSYCYRDGSDAAILDRAARDVQAGAARFYFVYLSELDGFLHSHCEDRAAMAKRLDWYAARVGKLFDLGAQADPSLTFAVLSDHGMTPVRRRHDLVKQVRALGFAMPRDYLAVYDSTMARFWFFNEEARAATSALLEREPCGRILPDEELRQLGVFFPDRRYGELVFLLHPGWLLAESDFNGAGWQPLGMHGYHPNDPHSDAIFLSNRAPRAAMRTIADVHRCMQEATA